MDLIEKYLQEDGVNEGNKEFPVNIIKKIEGLTNRNDHNAARILVAKTMKDKKLEGVYTGISMIHSYYGDMPRELYNMRNELDMKMFELVKSNYSNGNDVYMAF